MPARAGFQTYVCSGLPLKTSHAAKCNDSQQETPSFQGVDGTPWWVFGDDICNLQLVICENYVRIHFAFPVCVSKHPVR